MANVSFRENGINLGFMLTGGCATFFSGKTESSLLIFPILFCLHHKHDGRENVAHRLFLSPPSSFPSQKWYNSWFHAHRRLCNFFSGKTEFSLLVFPILFRLYRKHDGKKKSCSLPVPPAPVPIPLRHVIIQRPARWTMLLWPGTSRTRSPPGVL